MYYFYISVIYYSFGPAGRILAASSLKFRLQFLYICSLSLRAIDGAILH